MERYLLRALEPVDVPTSVQLASIERRTVPVPSAPQALSLLITRVFVQVEEQLTSVLLFPVAVARMNTCAQIVAASVMASV